MPCESREDPLKCDIEEAESNRQPYYAEYVSNTDIEIRELYTAENLEIAQSEEIICSESSLDNRKCHEKYVPTENISIITKNHEISTQTEDKGTQSIHYYKNNDKAIHFYTGLENFKKLLFVFQTLGQCVNKLNYFYRKPPKKVDALEQFFITVLILRRHKPFEEIAMMFAITIYQVYNIFITWVRFMSLQWKNLDLWLDKDSVRAYMPLDFYDKFPSTRVVIDATECPIKKPKLPFAQQVTFSMYKNRNTIKFLIGITPSGMINYVSPCYGGSATDRQIIERSSILSKFDYNDEIMVDKGLNVQDIFMPYGVKVNMPSFFKKGNQIGPQTLISNRKVASKRVHVERIIGLLKTYKILSQPLNQTETMLSSDIVFICAMLVNFRSSIVNKNA